MSGSIGMGETEDEVIGAVAAQVAFLVAEMQPGQTLTIKRYADPERMFGVNRTQGPTQLERMFGNAQEEADRA